jgi:hypothetical protein
MKPVMEAVLGHWYWQYFQQNRWRFMQRTQTAEPPGADITTWDLATILAEIDKHFTLALAAEQTLKATPISAWNDLIEKGTVPDTYRPTLYDFLVFDALSFYSSGEQAGALPQDTFEIMADDPIFAPAAEFLAWQPRTRTQSRLRPSSFTGPASFSPAMPTRPHSSADLRGCVGEQPSQAGEATDL